MSLPPELAAVRFDAARRCWDDARDVLMRWDVTACRFCHHELTSDTHRNDCPVGKLDALLSMNEGAARVKDSE